MAAHTKIDLYQMQSLPLDAKIRMTARRIDAFIDRNDAYLSISGGKDSRVLDDIERRFVRAKLPRVFIDTGLEHRSVRACGKKHADIILRPEKNFKQIITEYGYPVISKEVAQTIAEARKGLKNGNCYTYRMAKLNGTAVDKNGDKSKYNIPQYKFLLDAPFRISHKCCDYMKKKPAKQYEKETGRLPIVATMAEESNLRLQKWLKHGCNAFDLKRPMSAPMSFWSEKVKNEITGGSCYLPCICWQGQADEAAQWQQGDTVELLGRYQSRQYEKVLDATTGEREQRTAYEVSVRLIRRKEEAENEC